MSKIDDFAKEFEAAVRKAFSRVYGKPRDLVTSESIRTSWSDVSVAQGWQNPDPRVVVIGTEYGWISDPWSSVRNEHKLWEKAMQYLREDGWDDVNFESINAAVHTVYILPPDRWQKILMKRTMDRMNP